MATQPAAPGATESSVIPFGGAPTPSPIERVAEFFGKRGFTEEQITRAGYRYISRESAEKVLGHDPASDGILIPYIDAAGAPIEDDGAQFARVRLLQVEGSGKYRQKSGSGVHARLTPNCKWDWQKIAIEKDVPLVLTEGEFKTDMANFSPMEKFGIPVIGLGGVDAWSGKAYGLALVPEIDSWVWKDRRVVIIFDHDAKAGPAGYTQGVLGAIERLAGALTGKGATVEIAHIGRSGRCKSGEKMGLDDYLIAGGSWDELLKTVEATEAGSVLRMLLTRFAVYAPTSQVLDLTTGIMMKGGDFHNVAAAIWKMLDEEGESIPASRVWVQDARRITVDALGQFPEHNKFSLVKEGGRTYFNTWPGITTEPKENSDIVALWQTFVEKFLGKEMAALFHSWSAHMIQKPWQRNYTSWFIVSPLGGIGKSVIGEALARAVGKVGKVFGPDALSLGWNYQLVEGCLLAVINELGEGKVDHKRFKNIRTADSLMVNEKFRPVYAARNFANFIVTSNEMVTHKTSQDERRDIVVEPMPEAREPAWREWIAQMAPIFLSPSGSAALLAHYLARDCSSFKHTAPAPHTAAKEKMSEQSRTPSEALAYRLLDEIGHFGVIENGALRVLSEQEGKGCDFNVVKKYLRHLAPWSANLTTKVDGIQQRLICWGPSEEQFKQKILSLPEAAKTHRAKVEAMWRGA